MPQEEASVKRACGTAVLFAALISMSASTVLAQAVGTISGTIKDGTGAVIPGVSITALNQGTGVTREAVSDDSGHYSMPLLPVGTYTLSTALPGFRGAENRNINLEVQQSRVIDFVVEVSGITTEVSVSSQMAQVE